MATNPLSAQTTPLPLVANTGHPNATAAARLYAVRSPFPQFDPNSEGTVWANPLPVIPIKPLPGTSGSSGGTVGYPL